jgi:hypothetical protein
MEEALNRALLFQFQTYFKVHKFFNMKYLVSLIILALNFGNAIAQSDTIYMPVEDIIKKLKAKDSINTVKIEDTIKVSSRKSYLDSIMIKTIEKQLFLIKNTSRESKSLKSKMGSHITNLYIGVLIGNKIIIHNDAVANKIDGKKGSKKDVDSIIIENYETGENVDWKSPLQDENYLSISHLKNTSTIVFGDSTLKSGFYAVASIQDTSAVTIKVEFFPTLESCKSAVINNANGVIFSIVPNDGSLSTQLVGFIEPKKSTGDRITFLKSTTKRKSK